MFGFGEEYIKAEYLTDEEKAEELAKQQALLKPIIPELKAYLSVDERISLKLKIENKAFKIEKYEHSYPHCWRTDKPVLYYPLDSWFIKSTEKKDQMIALNKTINWKPASTGTGRFGNWLENLNDWNLSRSRFWGIPLPIWSTEEGDEHLCIESAAQLKEEIEKAIAAGLMDTNPMGDFDPTDMSDENYAGECKRAGGERGSVVVYLRGGLHGAERWAVCGVRCGQVQGRERGRGVQRLRGGQVLGGGGGYGRGTDGMALRDLA